MIFRGEWNVFGIFIITFFFDSERHSFNNIIINIWSCNNLPFILMLLLFISVKLRCTDCWRDVLLILSFTACTIFISYPTQPNINNYDTMLLFGPFAWDTECQRWGWLNRFKTNNLYTFTCSIRSYGRQKCGIGSCQLVHSSRDIMVLDDGS